MSGFAVGEGLAVGIGIFVLCSGEACGFGEAVGICMPGMFVCIGGDGEGDADCVGDDEGLAVIFISGMLPIWFLFAEFFCAGVFFLLDAALRRCIPDIFVPGLLIPGILPIRCFLASRLFRATLLFLGAAFRLAFDLDFGIFVPGWFCMSLP
jgi:hypothetical protein